MRTYFFQTMAIGLGIFLILGSGGSSSSDSTEEAVTEAVEEVAEEIVTETVEEAVEETIEEVVETIPNAPSNFNAVSAYKGALLSWDETSNASSYELCYAMENIASFDLCANYSGGTSYSVGTATSINISSLTTGTPYYFQVRAKNSEGIAGAASAIEIATPSLGLNDSGITVCREDGSINIACSLSTHTNQDAHHGLDATAADNTDGHAGFSFTLLDNTGATTGSDATSWACAKDEQTGLIWEVKSIDGNLHNTDDTFTFYSSDSANNGSTSGDTNSTGDSCDGYDMTDTSSYCNTEAFIERVNATAYCGLTNWRLPTRQELQSIINYDNVEPAADLSIFPNTSSNVYWSGTSVYSASFSAEQAWATDFNYGGSSMVNKTDSHRVRLVSDGQ